MNNKSNYYENKYSSDDYYWGLNPSSTCLNVLKFKPPEKPYKLLELGCGEGRNSIFFARNGYQVTTFDLAQAGVDKTNKLADRLGLNVNAFKADILDFRLEDYFDIIFSTGNLHYLPLELREEVFQNYKTFTNPDGIHMLSVFVKKPFIAPAPEKEINSHKWYSGELFGLYHDWKIEYCTEEIFDCMSSRVPHKHATNRILSRKIEVEI